VENDREQRPDKSMAELVNPVLEREIDVTTETGCTASPIDVAALRRNVNEENYRTRRGES
jgi:hypothetical protein